jgi:putative flippase GtrA
VHSALRLTLQYARFGTVGLAATLTHALMFAGLIEFAGFAPLLANLIAFSAAVLVSFLGHFHWTFRKKTARQRWQQQRAAFVRFAVVALTGLALNSLAVVVVVNLLALPYQYALLLMIGVVPVFVFVLSKFWAFA